MIFKRKPKKQIPYCKDCQFYIDYSPEIISISGKENEDGKDICGHSINTDTNHIGHDTFVTQGSLSKCEECGSILRDDRQPIYRKCKAKNAKKNCKDFLPITRSQLLKNKVKYTILSIKNMIKSFNITKSYILLSWLTFNTIFLVHNNAFSEMDFKKLFYYIIITILSFGIAMKK